MGGGLSQGPPGEEREHNQAERQCDGDLLTGSLLEGLRGRLATVTVQTSGRAIQACDSSTQGASVCR